jgi:hypothetical protein
MIQLADEGAGQTGIDHHMHTTNTGDPTKSPFVYFVSGTAAYPPNSIYESAEHVLGAIDGAERQTASGILNGLVKQGFIGGTRTTLPEAAWFGLIRNFLLYSSEQFSASDRMFALAVECLRLMTRQPADASWPHLRDLLLKEMDELSGWNQSWIKQHSQERSVFRGEDGNYYFKDMDGILIQIIGDKTAPENHLDFLTDQILRNYGCVRAVLNVFSLFAVANDFARNPGNFPRSMKLVLTEPRFRSTGFRWNLMQFSVTRSVKWRPPSNYCDPDWLSAELLARLTDTLDRDLWKDMVARHQDAVCQLDQDCRWEIDYVLDTTLAIGDEQEIYFKFEGRTFHWINGTPETKPLISVGVKDLNGHREEDECLNRLLSALVWQHRQPVVKEGGVGGARRAIPLTWAPRSNFRMLVDPRYLLAQEGPNSPDRWLALALYKEGVNAGSVFYRFLNFWKIIELALKDKQKRWDWINQEMPKLGLERERVAKILAQAPNVAEYLDYSGRCAIAHVFHSPIINPDDHSDYVRISQDVRFVEALARLAIQSLLA